MATPARRNLPAPPLLRREQLEALDGHLIAQRAPVAERVRPGLEREAMADLVEPLGLRLPEEAVLWWGWHDGAAAHPDEPASAIALGPFGRFEPLAIAVEHCRTRRQIARDARPDHVDLVWPAFLLPLLDFGDIAIACNGPRKPAAVWRTNPHAVDAPELVARSLGELVGWWLEGFQSDAYVWSPQQRQWLVDQQFHLKRPQLQGLT